MKKIMLLLMLLLFSQTFLNLSIPETDISEYLELNENNVYLLCKIRGIKHPDIVTSQSILETGYYTSKVCKEYKNIFGLYNSRTKDYYKFKHWSESIDAYKSYIQNKYKNGEDYYKFLNRIGYAEDEKYIEKVKKINKRNKNY